MNLAKILKDRRDAERRLEQTSPKPVFNGGTADSIEGGGNEIISDGVTLAQLTTGLAGKSNTDHTHEFTDLTDAPSAYTGAGGKIVAVNSGATALEFIASPAAANGVPSGGTTNQLAAKNSNTDYDLKWVDAPNAANGIPTGGTTEQILSKIDGTDYNVHWVDKPNNVSGGGNLALAKTYTKTTASTSYPDTNNKEMTDGRKATTAVYSNASYTGWQNTNVEIVVDLASERPVSRGVIFGLSDTAAGMWIPASVEILTSTDNSTFISRAVVNPASITGNAFYVVPVDFSVVAARYIKFIITRQTSKEWIFLDEVEVW